MGGPSAGDEGMLTGINVTPLVDITLVLLVIFMVTAQFLRPQGVPMDLPKAATAGAVQPVFTVSVDAQGLVYVGGQRLAEPSALRPLAAAQHAADAQTRTVVQADGRADYASVLQVVDLLRQAGMQRIAFAAENPGTNAKAP